MIFVLGCILRTLWNPAHVLIKQYGFPCTRGNLTHTRKPWCKFSYYTSCMSDGGGTKFCYQLEIFLTQMFCFFFISVRFTTSFFLRSPRRWRKYFLQNFQEISLSTSDAHAFPFIRLCLEHVLNTCLLRTREEIRYGYFPNQVKICFF